MLVQVQFGLAAHAQLHSCAEQRCVLMHRACDVLAESAWHEPEYEWQDGTAGQQVAQQEQRQHLRAQGRARHSGEYADKDVYVR